MESFDYSSDSDSFYYSFDEEEEDFDDPDAPNSAPYFLGSTNGEPFYKDWQGLRMMVCISAARILLAETLREGRDAGSVKPFEGEVVLKVSEDKHYMNNSDCHIVDPGCLRRMERSPWRARVCHFCVLAKLPVLPRAIRIRDPAMLTEIHQQTRRV